MTNRVLFVTYGGGHAPMITAVSYALRTLSPSVEQVALGLPLAREKLIESGLDVIGFEDVLDPTADQDARIWGKELAEIHHSPHTNIPLDRSIAYLGLSFKDLVKDHGEAKARLLVTEHGRHAFFPRYTLERIIDRVSPDLVVTTNSPRAEAAAIEVANSRGIATISMTDLFMGMKHHRNRAQDIVFLNKLAAFRLSEAGIVDLSKSRAHYFGNPALDKLFEQSEHPNRNWISQTFAGAGSRKMVLFVDMPGWVIAGTLESHVQTRQNTQVQLLACANAAQIAGVDLAIRPHPSQNPSQHHDLIKTRQGCYFAGEVDLIKLLVSVDAVISRSSTVALETVMLRRKLIQLEPWRHPDMPLVELGAAWGADSFEDLAKTINSALRGEGWQSKLKSIDRNFPPASAAAAVANLIVERLIPTVK